MIFSYALLDSATVHAAATTFERRKINQRIRPINILALTSLLDGFILFNKIIIDQGTWDYFCNQVPGDWLWHLDPVVEVRNIEMPDFKDGLEEFLSSDIVFYLINALLHSTKNFGILDQYVVYTGRDFGMHLASYEDLHAIDLLLKQKWNWDYRHANQDHIDVIHACWRGMQYSEFCSKNQFCYYPHEIRGSFFDAFAALKGYRHPEPYIQKVMGRLRKEVLKDRIKQIEDYPDLSLIEEEDLALWKSFKMPLLASRAFQRCARVEELFDQAQELREKAAPFRRKCSLIDQAKEEKASWKVDKLYKEFISFFGKSNRQDEQKKLNWSLSLGYPFSLSIGIGGDIFSSKPHFNLIRDLFSCKSIPAFFQVDLVRLFGPNWLFWLNE